MATPSTLGSHEKASVSRSMSGACRRSRSAQARSSSSLNALSRLIIGTRWRTSWKRPDGAAPTACVGESGVASAGIVRLELPQLHHEEVVLGVGDLGRIEHVVQLVVVDDLLAELRRPGCRLAGATSLPRARPRQAAMPAPTTASGSSAS